MSNELTIIPEQTVTQLDAAAVLAEEAGLELAPFKRSVMIAAAVNQLRELLTGPVLKEFVKLKDTAVGFLTDKGMKDSNGRMVPYSDEQIRDALIEAAIAGVYPVGNQFNIIQGRCYITKEGFHHLLKNKVKGLQYDMTPEVPQLGERKGTVRMKIHWIYNNEEHTETIPFVVKLNAGMAEDAAIGKATRKARAWLYQMVTGAEIVDGDVDEKPDPPNTIVVPQKGANLKDVIPKASPYNNYKKDIEFSETVDALMEVYKEMSADERLTETEKESIKSLLTSKKEALNAK